SRRKAVGVRGISEDHRDTEAVTTQCRGARQAAIALLSAGSFFSHGCWSADAPQYPTRPIRLIVPFAPGGPVDGMARVLAPQLSASFKQSVVVDNRPGASGMIGIEAGVRANPDGYTILMVSSSYAGSAATYQLPYDPVNDVAPIVLLGVASQLAAVHPSVPIASVPELIAYAKANPGKLNYGSSGTGGSVHLATELFNQMAGTRMTHVPYKGQGPALNDVLGGQIQLLIGSPMVIYPHVKSNRLRGIAVTSAKRSDAMPDIPAFAETVPGYENLSWQAVLGPKALPREIAIRWNTEINRVLQLPEMKERLAGDSMEVAGGSPERFFDRLQRDVAKWRKVVRTANIKPGT
ncbi:MAG: tripartite tricarboxylate transporter substrate binding protein, partial [Burkholderiales bacterium]